MTPRQQGGREVRLLQCLMFVLVGLALGCPKLNDAGSTDAAIADAGNEIDQVATCIEKQESILEQSGWDLDGGLGAFVDSLMQRRATAEDLPICTEMPP